MIIPQAGGSSALDTDTGHYLVRHTDGQNWYDPINGIVIAPDGRVWGHPGTTAYKGDEYYGYNQSASELQEDPEVVKARYALLGNLAGGLISAGGQVGAALVAGQQPQTIMPTIGSRFGQQVPQKDDGIPTWAIAAGIAGFVGVLLVALRK